MYDRFIPRIVYDEMFALMDSVNARKEELHSPFLMVLSRDDAVTDLRAAEEFFHGTPAGRKSLVHIENSSHAVPIDEGWEEVVTRIERFIREDQPSPDLRRADAGVRR
jgi:esterase/lipase